MHFYFFIFFILLLLSFCEIFSLKRKITIKILSIIIFVFFIFSFIRWETGTDWQSYYDVFKSIKEPWVMKEDVYSLEFESGFMFLNHLAKSISDSYTIMLFLQGAILFFCLNTSLVKYSLYPIFSLLIFYSMSLAGIFFVRQTIAMCILLCAIPYITQRNKAKFIIIVILATLIHRTAIIFLISYPLFHYRLKLRTIIVVITIAIFSGIIFKKLVINILSNLNLGIISLKINAYLMKGSDESYGSYSSAVVLLRGLINRSLLIAVYLIILNKIRINKPLLNGLINLNLLGVIFYVTLSPISYSLSRVTVYFDIMQIFIIPYLFKYANFSTKKILFIFFSLYLVFRLYIIVSTYPEEYIPFKTII